MRTLYESILDDIDISNNTDEVLFATICNSRDAGEFWGVVEMLENKVIGMKCKQYKGTPQSGKLIQFGQDWRHRPAIWLLDYDKIPRQGRKIYIDNGAKFDRETFINPAGCRLYRLPPKGKSLFDSGWKIISENL